MSGAEADLPTPAEIEDATRRFERVWRREMARVLAGPLPHRAGFEQYARDCALISPNVLELSEVGVFLDARRDAWRRQFQ